MTKAFRNRIILSNRETGRRLIGEAAARGEITGPADTETALDMIYAPVFYRLLVGHLPLDPAFAESLVTRALALLAYSDDPSSVGKNDLRDIRTWLKEDYSVDIVLTITRRGVPTLFMT